MALFLVTLKLELREFGWREFIWWSGPDFETCRKDCAAIGVPRRSLLSSEATLDSITITGKSLNGVDTPGSEVFYSDLNAGPGLIPPAIPATVELRDVEEAVWLRCYDPSSRFKRTLWIRGLPYWMTSNLFRSALSRKLGGNLAAALAAYVGSIGMSGPQSILPPAGAVPGGGNAKITGAGRFGLLVRAEPGLSPPLQEQISAIFIDVSGCHWVVQVPISVTHTVGQRVHVGGIRGCGWRGINGDTKIIAITTASVPAGYQHLTLARSACCNPAGRQYNQKGFLYVIHQEFASLATCTAVGASDRKTGISSYATKGRRSKGCCA